MPSVGYATLQVMPSVRGIGDELRRQLIGPAGDAGSQAGQEAGGGLKDKLIKGAAVAGAAAGALVVKGLTDAMEQANITSTLQAQLGATGKQAARYGKVAGQLFAKGITEDFESGAEAIRSVVNAGLVPPDATNRQLRSIATTMSDVATTFGTDMGMQTQAVSALMKNGLAPSAKSALDLITVGMQRLGPNAEDLLETFQEYPVQLRKLGLDAKTSMGLFSQGLKAGARDTDIIADGLKEFSIRAIDMSTSSQDAYKALGLNAEKMSTQIAKGGKGASAGLQTVLDRLRGIKDPVKQAAAATGLFGTQAEDMGKALLALDPSKATTGLGKVGGAAGRLGKALRSGPSYELKVFARTLQQSLVDFLGGQVLPILGTVGSWINTNVLPPLSAVASVAGAILVPALQGLWNAGAAVVGWLQDMGTWLIPIGIAVGGLALAMSAQAIATGLVTAAFSAYRAAILIGTAVTNGFAGAQALLTAVMNANPIILVITAIVALGAALVVAYNKSETFRGIVQGVWQGIATGATWLWNTILKPVFEAFKTGLSAIGTAAQWLWTNVLSPVFSFISGAVRILATVIGTILVVPVVLAVKALGAIFSWLWTTIISPVANWIGGKIAWLWTAMQPTFELIKAGFRLVGNVAKWLWTSVISPVVGWIVGRVLWLWNNGIKPVFNLIKLAFSAVGKVASWLWKSVVQPVFGWIGDKAVWLWNQKIKPAWELFKAYLRLLGGRIKDLWNTYAKPVFTWIGDKGKWLWDKALKPAFDWIKKGIKAVGRSFEDAKDFIGKAWAKVQDIAKKPVRFIINTVYNQGIVPVWNKIAGAFGAPKIKTMNIKGWATGGPVFGAGTETSDDVPAWLSRNEHVWTAREVRGAGGHGAVAALRSWAAAGGARRGTPGFKDGGGLFGWIGSAGSALKGLGSAAWEGIKKGAKWLADTLEASARAGVKNIVNPLLAKLPGADTGFGKMVRKLPDKMLDTIFGYSKKADDKGASYSSAAVGGTGVKRWSNVVLQALRMVGQPASLLNTVLRRMNQESGGNPRAINNWDINAKNGDPSRGLMQTIGSTFNAYAGKLRGRGIYDPLANVYASMRYALARYGSLSRAYNRAGGYANGGRPRAGELAWVGERGPELLRFRGGEEVYDHRTSLGMAAGMGLRGFAKGSSAAARKAARGRVPADLSGFTKSLTGSASTIASASKKLATDLAAAGGAGRGLAKTTARTSLRLQTLAKQRDSVASKLETAKTFAGDQKKAVTDYLGLSQFSSATDLGEVLSGLEMRLGEVKSNRESLTRLSKRGLSKSAVSQLAGLGMDSTLPGVLAGATSSEIKTLNRLLGQGSSLATSYGNGMADLLYDSGKNASKGFLKGLQSQDKELQAAMNKLGAGMVKSIKRSLRIKSPSRVMRDEVGAQVGAGLVNGMDGTRSAVAAAAARMAATAAGTGVSSSAIQPSARAAGDGQPVIVEVHTRDEALSDFIEVKVDGATQRTTRVVRTGRRR